MALRIKKGSVIYAYGQAANAFDDQSELSQPILEHLKTRFPDDIEDSKGNKAVPVIKVSDIIEVPEAEIPVIDIAEVPEVEVIDNIDVPQAVPVIKAQKRTRSLKSL